MSVTHITGQIVIPPIFKMQEIYDSVTNLYPSEGTVVGISIPMLGIKCNETGVVNPFQDIKEAVVRMYNDAMGQYLRPAWNALFSIFNTLSAGVLDFKLPLLDLTLFDLFEKDSYNRIEIAVAKLYAESKEKVRDLCKLFSIPFPLFTGISDAVKEVQLIVKALVTSFWDETFKKINQMITMISAALFIYDRIRRTAFQLTWEKAIAAIFKELFFYMALPASVEQLQSLLIAHARSIYNTATVTYEQLIQAMKSFKVPFFGSPMEFNIDKITSKVSIPELDFASFLIDMKVWLGNVIVDTIKQFIFFISGTTLLNALGINLDSLDEIKVPIVLCITKE
jgi:hypothetical protein